MSRTIRIGAVAVALLALGAVGAISARAEGHLHLHLHRMVHTVLTDAHLEAPPATPQAPKS